MAKQRWTGRSRPAPRAPTPPIALDAAVTLEAVVLANEWAGSPRSTEPAQTKQTAVPSLPPAANEKRSERLLGQPALVTLPRSPSTAVGPRRLGRLPPSTRYNFVPL